MNAAEFRKALISALNDVIEDDNPAMVSTAKGNAVILSEKNYNGILETITILSQEEQNKKSKKEKRKKQAE